MPDSELAVVSVDSFPTPTIITRARPSTRKKFFEFFTVQIRNANTRAAYYRAIQQFLAWAERAGYQDLEDIEPITVAAYIEILQRLAMTKMKLISCPGPRSTGKGVPDRIFRLAIEMLCDLHPPTG